MDSKCAKTRRGRAARRGEQVVVIALCTKSCSEQVFRISKSNKRDYEVIQRTFCIFVQYFQDYSKASSSDLALLISIHIMGSNGENMVKCRLKTVFLTRTTNGPFWSQDISASLAQFK